MSEAQAIRVWDLPTRAFHWSLAILVVFSIVSARLGGGAMVWHFRSGYAIFALLAFRLLWGFFGGRWSRFRSFVYAPSASLRYLRGRSVADDLHDVGHSPLGALSVFALLGVLIVQVATGLVADDEIASSGPLVKYVTGAASGAASHWHKLYGQWLIIGLVLLHVAAISFYALRHRRNLIGPMLHGDKALTADVPASVDTPRSRALALTLLTVCAIGVAAVAGLGE